MYEEKWKQSKMTSIKNAKTLVGKNIGRYKIVEYLGSGAMASVYKGLHETLNRHEAIKVLHSEYTSNEKLMEMFKQEARSLASLTHPNIVQVYDFDVADDIVYIVMEYIDGRTLRQVIGEAKKEDETLPIKDAIKVVRYTAKALAYAHKMNMIHRDVKPENIMIEKSGRVVLADFGFAKLLTGNDDKISKELRGTPAYMAPEQGMGKPVSDATDIYALGVIFYELVTGKFPFFDKKPLAIIAKHVNEKVIPPRKIKGSVPKKVEDIILKALEKDPKDRFQSAKHLLKVVEKLKEGKTDHLPSASLVLDGETKLPSKSSKLRLILHFMNNGQILELPEGKEFTIGRLHEKSKTYPDIDLTPFKGLEWGISRLHAKLLVEEDTISVVDLGSLNGTWISGNQLEPDVSIQLKHSDVVRLGHLKMQVLIYQDHSE